MKKRLYGFILPILICALMPLGATAEFPIVLNADRDNLDVQPGDTVTFTAEVRENGSPVSGQTVEFRVDPDDGGVSLSTTSATTDSNGQAQTTLTTGSDSSRAYWVVAAIGNKSTARLLNVAIPLPPPPPRELSMVVIHPPGSADPGRTMTFIVEVREDGSPVSTDETVTFSITSGDGNAWLGYWGTETTRSGTTSGNGRASTTIRLGKKASGSYTVTASTGNASVSVTASVKTPPPPPPPPPIALVSGPPLALYISRLGTLEPGESVTFTVEATEDGNAVSGRTVTFSLNPDDGTASLSPTSATTDSSGRASTTLTLGSNPASGYAVSATDGVAQVGGSVRTTTPRTPPSYPIVLNADRDNLNVQPGDTVTFTAEVRENGSPVSGQTVEFRVDPDDGGVSLSTTSATTDSNGQAQTTLTTGSDSSRAYWVVAAIGNKSTARLLNVAIPLPPPPPRELSMVVIHPPGSADPGRTMTFIVEVREDGSPVSTDETVTFSITSGDGNAWLGYWGTETTRSGTTSGNGRASTTIRLGKKASGSYTVTASTGSASVSVTATAVTPPPPPPTLLVTVVTHPGSGAPGDALTFTVSARKEGKPASGETVRFRVSPNNGTVSLSPTSTTTDSNGHASTTVTLGNRASGSYSVSASVGGQWIGVYASVVTPSPRGLSISAVGGPGSGESGEALPFTIEVQEGGTPVSGKKVTFRVSPNDGTASFSSTSATTDSNGQATTTLTLGSDPGTNTVEVSVEGVSQMAVFSAEVTLPPPTPTTLSIISGDNQSGLTGEVLANPFVVEVRDRNGDPLEGVTVNFAIGVGGGMLSDTAPITDANGQAESTLTLGSYSRTHTVEVSIEGVAETVTFNAIAEILEFDLSVPAGISMIHVPIEVRAVDGMAGTIESISDLYDALGGAATVNMLITLDPDAQRWQIYPENTNVDWTLTDQMGIIANMRTAVSIRLGGDALGVDGISTITLNQGVNLVGPPLMDPRITRVSDLFALEGIKDNVSSIILLDDGLSKAVRQAGDDGDSLVTGGSAFLLTATEAARITVSGDGWANTASGTMAAPPLATGGIQTAGITPVLALTGSVIDSARRFNGTNFHVIVKNLSTGNIFTDTIDIAGSVSSQIDYQLAIVDIEGGRAAAVGDTLEVSVSSTDAAVTVPLRYTLTAEDVRRQRIQLPALKILEMPTETKLLPNYPNPFNPETWIPYHLAADADVQLTIYDTQGITVRRLDIGHQMAGYYTNWRRAAYWDGRNGFGERVATGIYFYHLQANNVSLQRKMVILK